MVTVLVGQPSVKFNIHEIALKATGSKYWQVVFENGFKETETGTVELPEDNAATFDIFMKWVYGAAIGLSQVKHTFFKIWTSLY